MASAHRGAWLVALLSHAVACAGRYGSLEEVRRPPEWVLTADDLRARVGRSGRDLGTELGRLTVVARLAASQANAAAAAHSNAIGPGGFLVFEDTTSARRILVDLVVPSDYLFEGTAYLIEGSVIEAPESPERWVLRGAVVAVATDL